MAPDVFHKPVAGASLKRLGHWVVRWQTWPTPERRLFREAVWRIFFARLQTRFLRFPGIAGGLKVGDDAVEDIAQADALAVAIRRAARVVPVRALCFEQALALQAMGAARRLALSLHYGLCRNDDGSLCGHVWVECEGQALLGGEVRDRFKLLTTFPSEGRGTQLTSNER